MKSWCESCMHRDCRAKDEPCKSCICCATDRDKPANYRELLSQPLERAITGEQCVSSETTTEEKKKAQGENKSGFEWIPVTERLPENGVNVLCWYEYYHWNRKKILPEYGTGYCNNGHWGGEVSTGRDCKVLAWMSLPEPPKEV